MSDLVTAYPDVLLNEEDDFISANFFVSEDLRGLLTGLGATDLVAVTPGSSDHPRRR